MIIQKNVLKIVVIVALVVFSHGCVGSFDSETINDSGTMNEYYEYLDIYNNDSQKYNVVVNDWIIKEKNYNNALPSSNEFQVSRRPFPKALSDQLKIASDTYKYTANRIYTHLEVFEQFIILNEDALKRNNVSTVQLKGNIQEWKEEIRLNLN